MSHSTRQDLKFPLEANMLWSIPPKATCWLSEMSRVSGHWAELAGRAEWAVERGWAEEEDLIIGEKSERRMQNPEWADWVVKRSERSGTSERDEETGRVHRKVRERKKQSEQSRKRAKSVSWKNETNELDLPSIKLNCPSGFSIRQTVWHFHRATQ